MNRIAFHQLHESIFTDHLREIRRLGRMRSPQARTRLGDEGGAK